MKANSYKNKNLVILESPQKAKTIVNYLDKKDYVVLSSNGHLTELGNSGPYRMGVDLSTFISKYRLIKKKKDIFDHIEEIAHDAKKVILATDNDREGEMIAYQLLQFLKIQQKYERITFNEITEPAIQKAIQQPHTINFNLVNAQETRRLIDRMIGFRLSSLLRKKINAKSAGRVQSVALKILSKRELEIKNAPQERYWKLFFKHQKNLFELTHFHNQPLRIKTEQELQAIAKKFNFKTLTVASVTEKLHRNKAPLPLTTSKILMLSNSKFGYSSKKTSFLLQKLYEGFKIKNKTTGLITYPRTDAMRYSNLFTQNCHAFITKNYDPGMIDPTKSFTSLKKTVHVQNAHESIRVTDITLPPEQLKKYLKPAFLKIYTLIYQINLASFMKDSAYVTYKITVEQNNYQFTLQLRELKQKNYLVVYNPLPTGYFSQIKYKKDQKITPSTVYAQEHQTALPKRYSEATLIKSLEQNNIGRPSTYPLIVSLLVERGYVEIDNKALKVTKKGLIVSATLNRWFSDIINESYTSEIEQDFDLIAGGKLKKLKILESFWNKFNAKIEHGFENMPVLPTAYANEKCALCHASMVYRYGRFGEFIGCSTFPKCRYIKPNEIDTLDRTCPKCKKGKLIIKASAKSKRNKKFIGCDQYNINKCDYIEPYKVVSQDKDNNARLKKIVFNLNPNELCKNKIEKEK